MKRMEWFSGLFVILACGLGGCRVPLPLETEPTGTTTVEQGSCESCAANACAAWANNCGESADCAIIPACTGTCNAELGGSKQCLDECATGFQQGYERDVYVQELASCTQLHCQAECSVGPDLNKNGQVDSQERYCGVASYYGDLVDFSTGLPFEGGCGECLRDECCLVGLKCGQERDCWDRYFCNLGCVSGGPPDGCPCQAEPAPALYQEFDSCRIAKCQGPC